MGSRGASIPPAHKRHAEDELTNEQRLSKRFHLLNISSQDGTLYSPVANRGLDKQPLTTDHNDSMQVDENRDKVYIYDLDKELEELDPDDENVVFLPDIERKMSKIPASILKTTIDPANQELVVYNVPSSLSVPQEQDNVRKAIVEARIRAREAQLRTLNKENDQGKISNRAGKEDLENTPVVEEADEEDPKDTLIIKERGEQNFGDTPVVEEIDEDAMDIG